MAIEFQNKRQADPDDEERARIEQVPDDNPRYVYTHTRKRTVRNIHGDEIIYETHITLPWISFLRHEVPNPRLFPTKVVKRKRLRKKP